ncbi:major facilitator superfamily domain-containing protein [Xylariales sp. PMI_506]|nr:major facilitator superfamily domain-containing protein [Xylariales sp. PMI_506]
MELKDDEEERPSPSRKPLRFYLAFVAMCIAEFVFSLDATTLAVAIPSIAAQLGGTTLESFWANLVYLLAVVAMQPLYSMFSDVFGRKSALHVAFLFFAVGSLVFALSRSMSGVIGGRVLQGLGGAGLSVLDEIVVADMTTLKERSLYLGLMVIPIAGGSILGPTVGALLAEFAGWRWIGWINLPLLGVAYPLMLFCLRLRPLQTSFKSKMKQLDFIGMALFATGSAVFALSLSWAGALYPWNSWKTILPLVIGFLALVGFAIYERLPAVPLMPYRLVSSRTAATTLCGAFIHGMVLYSILFYLPIFFQAVTLETVIGSALTLLPTSFGCVLAAGAVTVVVSYTGTYRSTIWFSWVVLTVGLGLLSLLSEHSSMAMRAGLPVVWAVGIGPLLRILHIAMQASVADVDDTAAAIGIMVTFRLLGGLFGLAIGATMFSSRFGAAISAIQDLPEPLAILRDANQAIAFIPMLRTLDVPTGILDQVIQAYTASIRGVFYLMTGFSGLALILSLFTDDLSLQRDDLGRQRFES